MDKTYQPKAIETALYQQWEEAEYFEPSGQGNPYCLMLPPPNVTGSLHMGHGFGSTIMDVLVRYHRMRGFNTLWQPGTDHAGIATQMVVERQLLQQNLSRHDLGREAFVKKIWEWKEESGGTITKQLRRLGDSLDWTRERFTMDESLSHAVREVFIRLYDEGLIYRGTRLVNWDPKLLTAISDLEVLNEEEKGSLWHIRYPLAESNDCLTVATTRPETMLGDVAVAVHPDDERFKHLIGKHIKLPLTDRLIPIIADDYVDPTFGSGCVKITPAHDFNDYAMGQRHDLTPINIFTPDAHINENAPTAYQGLERFQARKKILSDLESLNLLEKTEKHTLKIPRGDRSGVVVEPYLTQQWFMKMQPLAEPALKVVEEGKIKFVPENWTKTYYQWLNNIEDWCISRQLWWGHRIPAWHDADGNIYVGQDENAVREKYQLNQDIVLTQDTDVLDTWFSSALWPFSTLGWPEQTPEFKTFYPNSVLVTGFDIIFFWVARMIMMGLKFTGDIPFHTVFITGLIRDAAGHKMSKSKGNVLDPLDLIDGISLEDLIKKRVQGLMQPQMAEKIEKSTRAEFPDGISATGTDALRFTFCALASHGREIRFDISRLEGYRNFCNKLWNASRYVMMNTEDKPIGNQIGDLLINRFIISKLQSTIQNVHNAFAEYRFDLVAHTLYDFVWNEFCDWYLELSKPILQNGTEKELAETRYTLLTVLETILRLLHPIMPFITEEIWQRVSRFIEIHAPTIMLEPYPEYDASLQDTQVESELEWLKSVIVAIRTIKSEMNISPGKMLSILLQKGNASDQERFAKHDALIKFLARVEKITWLTSSDTPPESATALVGDLEILIPMAGLINKAEEQERLNREIVKLNKELEKTEAKLQNSNFVDRAPEDVVKKEQAKLAEMKQTLTKLETQLSKISEM